MKVRRIGRLNQKEVILTTKRPGDVVAILTNNTFDQGVRTIDLCCSLLIGEGRAAREIRLDLPVMSDVLVSQHERPTNMSSSAIFHKRLPTSDEYLAVFLFKNQIFAAETEYVEDTSEEEALLLIKQKVYSDDAKLKRLRQEVDAMERVMVQVENKRKPIPETTKLIVYGRDEGKCVRCGSSQNLHFDHIIPVAKGGGNAENNIQLLCEYCNLQKSDRIAF